MKNISITESTNENTLKTHFEVLDGLRGIAAISVVIYHLLGSINTNNYKPVGHAYLAVDFFFCLSGFVIGYAYDDRIKTIGTLPFFRNRIIRLHPLVVLGTILGIISLSFNSSNDAVFGTESMRLIITSFFSFLLIPSPKFPGREIFLYPLNAVNWSLFMEYIANFFYGLGLWKINRLPLSIFTFIAGILLIYVSWYRGNLDLGWAYFNFVPSLTRIAYSFSVGLLIHRCSFIIEAKNFGFLSLSLLLLLVFFLPFSIHYNWLIEVVIVIFIFPLIVSLGTTKKVYGKVRKLCVFLGDVSYPLYMTHVLIINIFANFYKNIKPAGVVLLLVVIGFVFISVIFSFLVLRYFDQPIRLWLKNRTYKVN